jgi:hypothetical protein
MGIVSRSLSAIKTPMVPAARLNVRYLSKHSICRVPGFAGVFEEVNNIVVA